MDKQFTKIAAQALSNVKELCEWGIDKGHTTPEQLRLTVESRKQIAKQLVESGVSQRQAAKVLGVTQGTIDRDLHDTKRVKNDTKRVTTKPPSFGDKFSKYVDAGLALRRAQAELLKEEFNKKRWNEIQCILEEIRKDENRWYRWAGEKPNSTLTVVK